MLQRITNPMNATSGQSHARFGVWLAALALSALGAACGVDMQAAEPQGLTGKKPPVCDGENPAKACRKSPDQCISSNCICTANGWACDDDCGGGVACDGVAPPPPKSDPPSCKGENPAQACRTSADQCIPSTCGCSDGKWICTADCGGGQKCEVKR